jgi:trehalose 6-phosphate phosphatase
MRSARQRGAESIDRLPAIDPALSTLLLDVDGTLLDIAPTPEDVHVAPSLKRTIGSLFARMNGAIALVSGRRIAALDELFAPLGIAAIGCHGAEMRASPVGVPIERVSALSEKVRQAFSDIAVLEPRVRMEDKTFSLAFHYRGAIEREKQLLALICERIERFAPELIVLPGKAVIEIKAGDFNKGEAVLDLLRQAPFAGRKPIFLGDDETDEDVFAVLTQLGGMGISVGRRTQNAGFTIDRPADVRRWLARLAGGTGAAQPEAESGLEPP